MSFFTQGKSLGAIVNKHKISIVGGAGFIGSALARYFSKEFKVQVLDKNPLPKGLSIAHEFHARRVNANLGQDSSLRVMVTWRYF